MADCPVDIRDLFEPIDTKQFEIIKVEKEGLLLRILEEKNMTFSRGCAFYELINDIEEVPQDIHIQVILLHKVGV